MNKYIILMGTLILCGFSVFAGGVKEEYGDDFTLNVAALNGPTGIGMIHMFHENPNLGEGVNAQYNVAVAPKALLGDLVKGDVDMAVLPANMPALLNAKDLGYKVACVTGMGVLYVVSRDNSVKSLDDLKGKTVYIAAKGSTPDFLTRYVLGKAGIDSEKDLYMDFSYSHADLAKAMIAGLVDIAVLPEPFVTMVSEKSDASVAIDLQQVWMDQQGSSDSYPMSALVIKEEIINKYPLMVRKFLKAYEQSINDVKADPAEAARLVPQYGFSMSSEVTEKAIPRINLKYIDGEECQTVLKDYYSILFNLDPKILGGSLPGDDLYYIEK